MRVVVGVCVSVVVSVVVSAGVSACEGCERAPPPPTSEPAPSSITVIDAPETPGAAGADIASLKGRGWYPNIEADAQGRLHLAWVDADVGDVRYAVSVAGGSGLDGPIVTVDRDGAAGAYLRLALGPGGAPLLSYARQDTQIFRFAWRPADRQRMRDAGADVDVARFPELPTTSKMGGPISLSAGFVGEELGFGDGVGRGHGITADGAGRIAIAYASSDDRLRFARRPADVAAFSAESIGVLEKRDLDGFARGSVRMQSDVRVLTDGTVVVAYAHDVVTDARLRVAILKPDAPRAVVIEDNRGATVTIDGLVSRIVTDTAAGPGFVDVLAHDQRAGALLRRQVDLSALAFTDVRERIIDIDGVVIPATKENGYFALARIPGENGGVFLYVVDDGVNGAARSTRRIRLGGAHQQHDSWLDLAVRPDGRPAAVWYDVSEKSLKLYAP